MFHLINLFLTLLHQYTEKQKPNVICSLRDANYLRIALLISSHTGTLRLCMLLGDNKLYCTTFFLINLVRLTLDTTVNSSLFNLFSVCLSACMFVRALQTNY